MPPTEHVFPVTSLPQQVHFTTKNFKDKSRKLPKDFDLKKDCELFEMVQYSCTTDKEMREALLRNPKAAAPMECFPFVRLFRRCGQGADMFHVETTSWEGEYKWEPKRILEEEKVPVVEEKEQQQSTKRSWLWSKS